MVTQEFLDHTQSTRDLYNIVPQRIVLPETILLTMLLMSEPSFYQMCVLATPFL